MVSLPTISVASIIIGFISFAFTFFTFVRVFWSSIRTMWSAPHESRAYFDNLRYELYDERNYFRHAMKDIRSKSRSNPRQRVNCAPMRLMNDSIKGLLQEFRRLEAPFVEEGFWEQEGDVEKQLNGGMAPKDAYVHGYEREGKVNGESVYRAYDFSRRYDWLRSKDDVVTLADQVNRIQTRRIGFDTNNVLQSLHHIEKQMKEFDDRLYGLEEAVLGETLSDGNVYVKRKKGKKDHD